MRSMALVMLILVHNLNTQSVQLVILKTTYIRIVRRIKYIYFKILSTKLPGNILKQTKYLRKKLLLNKFNDFSKLVAFFTFV